MASANKMQAEAPNDQSLAENERTASELSSDHAIENDPYVGIGIRKKRKITLLRASEITEDDLLFPEDALDNVPQGGLTDRWLKRKLRKFSALYWAVALFSLGSLAGGVIMILVGNENSDFNYTAKALIAGGLMNCWMYLVGLLIGGRKMFREYVMEKLAPGALKAPQGFTRVDGSYYNVNTPSYEELQEAFNLLNKVSSAHEQQKSSEDELKELTKARKDRETLSRIEKLNIEVNECADLIKNSEKRIAELLGSDGIKEEE